MDTDAALTEPAPTAGKASEPLDRVRSAPPKTHHFILYGRANPSTLSAFAAAKALLESAGRAARRKIDGRASAALKLDSVGRYVVRFTTGGRAATRGVDGEIEPAIAFFAPDRGIGEHTIIDEGETEFAVTVCLGPRRGNNILDAADNKGSRRCSTFDFTVINHSVIHCVRVVR